MRGPAVLLPALVAVALLPSAGLAGIPVGPAPGSAHCVVVNDDTCWVGPYAPLAQWGFGFQGVFVGDLTFVTDTEGYHHAIVCTDMVLVSAFALSLETVFASCPHEGVDPPQNVPVTLGCITRGVGFVACSVAG